MRRGGTLKTATEIAKMRAAGRVVAAALATLRTAVRPGVTTADLDHIAAAVLREAGARPSFLGYHGFPATICTSVNDEIVHGIPSAARRLCEGDLVSIDCGAIVEGWHGDAAITVPVGAVATERLELISACEQALVAGVAAARVGGRLSDIGDAISTVAGRLGYGLVEEYVGHGIGTSMHEDPAVPNVAPKGPGRGVRLRAGMVLAIEPMLTLGGRHTHELGDGWTVVTADGSVAAHAEHTVAITDAGPRILTCTLDG